MVSIEFTVIVIALGIGFAAVYAFFTQKYMSEFVQKLINNGADSQENARAVSEIGLSPFARFMSELFFYSSSTLKRFVKSKYTREELAAGREVGKELFQRYYVENCEEAGRRFKNRGGSPAVLAAFLAALVIITAALVAGMPYIKSAVSGAFDSFSAKNEAVGDTVSETVVTEPDKNDDAAKAEQKEDSESK